MCVQNTLTKRHQRSVGLFSRANMNHFIIDAKSLKISDSPRTTGEIYKIIHISNIFILAPELRHNKKFNLINLLIIKFKVSEKLIYGYL